MQTIVTRLLIMATIIVNITEQSQIMDQSPITYIKQVKSLDADNKDYGDYYSAEHRKLSNFDDGKIKGLVSNKKLLNALGLKPSSALHLKNSHEQLSRILTKSNYQPDNSRMFIIKLPPNYNYYTNENENKISEVNEKVSLGFRSNGKPGAIYHWNLPLIESLFQLTGRNNRITQNNESLNFANNLSLKARKDSSNEQNKNKKEVKNINAKRKSFHVYYAPPKREKLFSSKSIYNNGKPKSFYIMKANNAQDFVTIK